MMPAYVPAATAGNGLDIEALEQIDTKDYALPFAADTRRLYKIGVSFDTASRKLVGWEARG